MEQQQAIAIRTIEDYLQLRAKHFLMIRLKNWDPSNIIYHILYFILKSNQIKTNKLKNSRWLALNPKIASFLQQNDEGHCADQLKKPKL